MNVPPTVTLIGFDCSTNPKKAGLACGTWDGGDDGVTVEEAFVGAADPAGVIGGWLAERPAGRPAVVAFDAPLGWPAPLAQALADHAAGEPLPFARNRLFRRMTDGFVHQTLGGQPPMSVGADRIARTAAYAVGVAGELRGEAPFPLLTSPGPPADGAAGLIEVYPAATLRARGLKASGYKGNGGGPAARDELLNRLASEVRFPTDRGPLLASDDAFDAAVCVLAAADFVAGRVHRPPGDLPPDTLRREGWIWFGPAD